MTKNTEDALKKLINKSKAKINNNRAEIVDIMVKNTMADLKRDRKRASWMSLGNKEKSETPDTNPPETNPPETNRSVSSTWPSDTGTWTSVLDGKGWVAARNDTNQWIEIYLGVPQNVARIITQGRMDSDQYVTEYKVQYKEKEEDPWTDVKNIQGSLIFTGNRSDGPERVSNELEAPVLASKLKIIPVSWHTYIAMRVGYSHYVPPGKGGIVAYEGTAEVDSEYTKTMSASGSTLKEWADNVVQKTIASSQSANCSVAVQLPSDRVCINGGNGEDKFNSCTAKGDMWTDLKTNPILRHFVGAWKGEDNTPINMAKYMVSPNLTNNQNGIGWLKIPTTPTNLLRGEWGSETKDNDHSNNYPKNRNTDYSIDGGDTITMLIVRKFTSEESKNIYDALQNQDITSPRESKIVSGHNFVFTKQGHISFIPPGKTPDDQITYLNPYINAENDTYGEESGGANQTGSSSASDLLYIDTHQSNTMAGYGDNGVGNFSGFLPERNGVELVYAMGPKTVMNRALSYILYTPANENDLIDTGAYFVDNDKALESIGKSRYYLLYNPIHTLEFRRFFQSQLQVNAGGSSLPDDTLGYKIPSVSTVYSAPAVKVHDPAGCRDFMEVPAYKTIIAKYCNAFQVRGLLSASGFHDVKHYSDPTCPYTMSTDSAFHAFATNSNITQQSKREDYYRLKDSSTAYSSYFVGNNRMGSIEDQEPYKSQTWACPGHGAGQQEKNIQGWMSQSGMLSHDSKSFMKDIVNSIVNKSVHKKTGEEKSIQRIPSVKSNADGTITPMTAAELESHLISTPEKWGLPVCSPAVREINLCSNVVNVAGDIVNSDTTQTSICGGPGVDDEDLDPDKPVATITDPDEAKLECQKLEKVPECAQYGNVGDDATETSVDGITIYTACCMHSNGTDIIDCPVPENGSCVPVVGVLVNPPEEGGNIEGGGNTSLSVSLGNLSDKITKAANVATTSKSAYQGDLLIIEKADGVLDETVRLTAIVSSIEAEISNVESVDNRDAIEINIGELADDIIELEKIETELVNLISAGYLFGQKKMYVFGAIGIIVLLIILFFFMRGGNRGSAPPPMMYPRGMTYPSGMTY